MKSRNEWTMSDSVEVDLIDDQSFLKITETLTRIGVASKSKMELTQSCNILFKQGKYFIVHFKILFALDGRSSDYNETDWKRQNRIAKLLEEWNLLKIVNPIPKEDMEESYKIKIIKYSDKHKWNLKTKYEIGEIHRE